MSSKALEKRVAVLEKELARLKSKLGAAGEKPWWERIAGSFENDPAHQKAYNLGRQYRESQRPKKSDKGK